jgi:hypothetical protein
MMIENSGPRNPNVETVSVPKGTIAKTVREVGELVRERDEARRQAEYYKHLAEQWFLQAGGDPAKMKTKLPWGK